MAAAAARSSSRAAATETRVWACSHSIIKMVRIEQRSPCSVSVHCSPVIISRRYHKIGDVRSKAEDDRYESVQEEIDQRTEVKDPSLLRSYAYCRDLVHRMLAEAPAARSYDLAADNWEVFEPHDIATRIVATVRRDTEDARGVVPAYTINIRTALLVTLIYSEPKALLLACRGEAAADETKPARALRHGRKRRRRETAGELCAICFSDVETKEEERVTLPCSHSFHTQCIEPWFHRASTCPSCRRDALERFGFVRSFSIEGS